MIGAGDQSACDFCLREPEQAGVRLAGRTACICQHCVGDAAIRLLQAYDLEKPGAVVRARAAGRDAAIGEVAALMDAIEGRRARPSSWWQMIGGALRGRRENAT